MTRLVRSFCRRSFLGALAALGLGGAPALAGPDDRLPDGEITRSGALRAWLVGPTRRYRHAVLGDDIEAEGLLVEQGQRMQVYRLPDEAVFEDRRVRFVAPDSAGRPRLLVVKSYLSRGSALALFAHGPAGIEPVAESPPVGQANRWLNPVGMADFTGTGEMVIAAVITPHLSGSLRLYRLAGRSLAEVARLEGVTNHVIGSRDLDLAHIHDADGDGVPEIVIPALDRRSVAIVSFAGGKARLRESHPVNGRIIALAAPANGKVEATLEDGARQMVAIGQAKRQP